MNKTDEIEIGDLVCYEYGDSEYTGTLIDKYIGPDGLGMADVKWGDNRESTCFLFFLKRRLNNEC